MENTTETRPVDVTPRPVDVTPRPDDAPAKTHKRKRTATEYMESNASEQGRLAIKLHREPIFQNAPRGASSTVNFLRNPEEPRDPKMLKLFAQQHQNIGSNMRTEADYLRKVAALFDGLSREWGDARINTGAGTSRDAYIREITNVHRVMVSIKIAHVLLRKTAERGMVVASQSIKDLHDLHNEYQD